jgi:hypothetical protein
MDTTACNYDPTADCDVNNTCIIPDGSTDMTACNYDSDATEDDGSCEYELDCGCMDMYASNYDSDATISCDECCEYPNMTFNISRDWQVIASNLESYNYVDITILYTCL